MNDDNINELKQFIVATIAQQTSLLRDDVNRLIYKFDGFETKFDRLESKVDEHDNKFDRLVKKIDDLSDSVAQAIHDSNNEVDKQLQDHETRITKLEAHPA